jgi:2-hydroxy-3-oxopropionate reductase
MPDDRLGRIAFIGTGVMGLPMARHLAEAGATVAAHTRTPDRAEPLRAFGVRIADSLADALSGADTIVTMLPDTPDVVTVLDGPDGAIELADPGSLVIDMSSISPVSTRRLAAKAKDRAIGYVDAPVSGGQRGAEEATLSIMVGGDPLDVERAMPVLESLGKTIRHLGPAGSGQVAKACNQIVVGVTIQAVAEAVVLGAKSGLDTADLIAVLSGGLARCGILETRGDRIATNDFGPGFRARLHHKDLGIALEAAEDAGVPVAATALVRDRFAALIAAGGGDLDHSGLVYLLQMASDA